jgi:hypothetical protein
MVKSRFALVAAAAVAFAVMCATPLVTHATAPDPVVEPTPAPAVEECTITGTPRSDTLIGTSGDDVICGLGGNDTIFGGKGDDIIRGGAGSDQVNGGGGDDELSGGAGSDSLLGGSGDDSIGGEAGRDNLSGGNGDDALNGGTGVDGLRSGAGDDTCTSDAADRQLDSCGIDDDAPVVTFQPSILEFQAGTTAVFRWVVEDASGVAMTWAAIGGPSGWVTEWCGFALPAEQIDGTLQSGTYELQCDIPANAVNESYTLFVSAADSLGNSNTVPGWAEFGFTVNGGSSDNVVPVINAVRLPDTVVAGETFTVDIDLSDDSGIAGVWSWFMGAAPYYYYNEQGQFISALDPAVVVSGDATNGTFRQSLVVSDWVIPGRYTLLVGVGDTVGNRGFFLTEYFVTVTE